MITEPLGPRFLPLNYSRATVTPTTAVGGKHIKLTAKTDSPTLSITPPLTSSMSSSARVRTSQEDNADFSTAMDLSVVDQAKGWIGISLRSPSGV
jgi:hypothetical protein